jgi:hypothetical protein
MLLAPSRVQLQAQTYWSRLQRLYWAIKRGDLAHLEVLWAKQMEPREGEGSERFAPGGRVTFQNG